MKKTLLSIAIILSATQVWGGYRDLKKDMDDYSPPSYLTPKHSPAPLKMSSGSELKAAEQYIIENKKLWIRALNIYPADRGFFQPSLVSPLLQETARDDIKTVALLKEEFSLRLLENLTYLRNQRLQAAKDRARAAIENFSQIMSLDEILRRYDSFVRVSASGPGVTKSKDSIKMKFPFPGVMALKARIAGKSVAIAFESLDTARRDEITAARKTYWQLGLNQESQKITKQMVGLLRDLESAAIARYEAGKTSFQDVVKTRIKRYILEENLITLKEKEKNFQSKINELLFLPLENLSLKANGKARAPLNIPSEEELRNLASQNLQELKILRTRIEKAELMIEMTETMVLPDYSLDFALYDKLSFPKTYKASKGMNLPKSPWIGVEDSYLRQTRRELKAMKKQLKHNSVVAASNTVSHRFKLDRAVRETKLYQNKIIDLSQSAMEVSAQEYEAGHIAFADVIDSYSEWLAVRLSLAEKQSEVGLAMAELSRAVGTDLVSKAQ